MENPVEFVEDIFTGNMIYALTIRSPVARGSLTGIECPELPDSCHLIKAEHIPGKNELAGLPVPVLADKRLSYIGQPVAILAGPDESKLEELAADIDLITEEEDPVFSGDNNNPADIVVERNIVSGEPDTFFGERAKIVSGTYSTGIQEHWYPEAHGAVAVHDNGAFTIHTATQWPFHVRRSVAGLLGWDSAKVRVKPTCISQHLDGKIWYPSLVACHAVLAAWVTGRNVKLMLTREEDFLYSPKRNRAEITLCSALGENGEILGSTIQTVVDLGADPVFKDEIMDQTCLGTLGTYNHQLYRINGVGLRTNIPAQGPLTGFGLAQGFFAAERHVSRIADSLGQDPAEWRKRNFIKPDQSPGAGISLKDPVPLAELIDTVAAKSDYYRKWASYELLRRRNPSLRPEEPLRGIGISAAFQGNGFLYDNGNGDDNCPVEQSIRPDKAPGWAAAVAEIEINPVSLAPFIRGIWLVVDGGRIISENRAGGVLRAGIIQALGWASREKLYYKDGKIPSGFFRRYDIPAPEEIPAIHIGFINNNAGEPKGIGELPFCCIPAAYSQAVSQAMDHHFEKIPLRTEDIWDAWKAGQTELSS